MTPSNEGRIPPSDEVVRAELNDTFERLKEAATELAQAVSGTNRLDHVARTHSALQRANEHIEGTLAALRLQAECGQ